MTALRLIDGEGSGGVVPSVPMRLNARSRRPGVAHEELELDVGSCASAVFAGAARDRLPAPLWSVIAIESERALLAVAPSEPDRGVLAARLDWLARLPPPRGAGETRLHAWAAALRRPPFPQRHQRPTSNVTLELIVPYHTLIAWDLVAYRDGLPRAEWALSLLASLLASADRGRALWEAAAAESGCTLGEWVALSAIVGRTSGGEGVAQDVV